MPETTSWDEVFQQAQGLQQQGQLEQAVELYGKCVELAPDRPEAYYKRANALNGLGRLEPALADYERAISRNPAYTYAFCNRGSVLERLGRRDEALASYDRALELDPKDALTHYNRGSVLRDLQRYPEAFQSYAAALALNPNHAEAHINLGTLLQEFGQHEGAVASFGRAIALNPTIATAHYGNGISLHYLRRLEDALDAFDKAIALKRDFADAYLKRAFLLTDLHNMDAAFASFDRAIALRPDDAEAYFHRGHWQRMCSDFNSAAADFALVARLAPGRFEFLAGMRLETDLQRCDWTEFDVLSQEVVAGIENDAKASHPFIVMALTDSARLQHKVARTWANHSCPPDDSLGALARRARPEKLRIGYFSSDLQEHPVGRLLPELIELHDRSRFESIAFSFGPATNDEPRQRLLRAFDRFIEVREKSNVAIAELARSLEIDVAVDLNGYTLNNRATIFALRAAPVQVGYLGYLGTKGAGYMDYLVADRTVVTPASESHYSEKIIYLPDTHQVYDRARRIADKVFTRKELGLPATGFVFCSFNNSYKILPEVFARWMRILGATGNSVLWLSQANATVADNLRREAGKRGIDGSRLIFATRVPSLGDHLARLRAADLFLDTFPYNAHSTALDVLWAGVPLLTYPGETFVSRVAASLLTTMGVPELIASTSEQYEQLAIELASNSPRLADLGTRIQANRVSGPLFDTPRFVRNLEAAYTAIHERYLAGLPADHVRL